MKKLLFLLSLLSLTVHAATYYVDYSAGNDANNGTAQGTPWKHLPGDPSATGTPLTISGVTGTIYLKGGVVYNLATSSGITFDSVHYLTAGPLLVTSGTNTSWGTGTPAIDGAGIGNWILTCSVTGATFQAIEMRNTVSQPDSQATAVTLLNTQSNKIDSCAVHDIGTNSTSSHADGIGPYNNSGARGEYHIITNCYIWNVTQKAIEPFRSGSNTIINNFIWNCRDHGIVASSAGNKIVGNIISNAAVTVALGAANSPGYGIKLADLGANGNLVYNNIIEHCDGGISIDNVGGNGAGNADNNLIANNTMIDISKPTGSRDAPLRMDVTSGSDAASGNYFMNNICCSEAAAGNAGAGLTTPTGMVAPYRSTATTLGNNNLVAYNSFFGQNAAINPNIYISGTPASPTWANFSDTGSTSPDNRFKVAANGTGNSFIFGNQFFNTDPLFVSYPGNLALSASSTIRTAGTNLSAFFTTDFRGNTRSSWSIGALEYLGDPNITVQPQNQTVATGATATFTVTATGTATIHYYWKLNGSAVGTDSSSYASAQYCSNNNASVSVLVSNQVSSLNSSTATLTVTGCGTPVNGQQINITTVNVNTLRTAP